MTPALIRARPIAPSTRANLMPESMDAAHGSVVAARGFDAQTKQAANQRHFERSNPGPETYAQGSTRPRSDQSFMDLAVEVDRAVVLLDRFPALAELTLTLPTGSVSLVQGPNGAGKTTLLRLLAGLATLESGSARVLGFDVATERRQVRASVGLLSPDTMFYEDLSIDENLAFWASLGGHGQESVGTALERVGLTEVSSQPVRTLSTGQRRRAALSAVAVRRPRLWLLDEPHAGLDQAGRTIVDELISDAIDAGATVIVASHEIDRVRPLATHVLTVAGGVVHRSELRSDRSTHD